MLKNILEVYSILDEELGYTQGMNNILALILAGTDCDEIAAFAIFEKIWRGKDLNWRGFYTEDFTSLKNSIKLIMEWINLEVPSLKRKFTAAEFQLDIFLTQPILTLFA